MLSALTTGTKIIKTIIYPFIYILYIDYISMINLFSPVGNSIFTRS